MQPEMKYLNNNRHISLVFSSLVCARVKEFLARHQLSVTPVSGKGSVLARCTAETVFAKFN